MKDDKTFIGALPIIAKAIGRQYGVNVKIGGKQAFTNGKTIHLPDLPEDDPDAAVLVNGYLDHEAAHCRFTDFEAQRGDNQFQNWVENVLEDIRIEALMGRCYPGCHRHLEQLTGKLVDDGVMEPLAQDASEAEVLSAYMLRRLRADVLGQSPLDGLAQQATERVDEVFPRGLTTKLTAQMGEVRNARSTQDVIDLAAGIVQMLKAEAEPPEEPDEPETEPDSDESGDSDEGSGADGNGDSDDSDQTDGSDDASDSDESNAPDDQSDDAGDTDQPNASDTDEGDTPESGSDAGEDDQSRRDALESALNADASEMKEAVGEQAARALEDQAQDAPDQTVAEPSDVDPSGNGTGGDLEASGALSGSIDETAVRQASARLRSRLASLIQAETLEDDSRARSGKRIDRRMLPRLQQGDPRVFRREAEADDVDTAVTILLDRSGSMSGGQLNIAREATLAITYALDEIEGVNPSVFAFPGVHGTDGSVLTLHRRGSRPRGRRFEIGSDGSTPLTEAAWFAGWDLLCAGEPRKILITVTDGKPDDMSSAIDVLSRMRASGIETLGIGIGTPILDRLLPESRMIGDVKELSGALFELLEHKLVAGAAA